MDNQDFDLNPGEMGEMFTESETMEEKAGLLVGSWEMEKGKLLFSGHAEPQITA